MPSADDASRAPGPAARRRLLVLVVVFAVVALSALALALGSGHDPGTPAGAGSPGPQSLDPSMFATGACVAYPPTHGDRHVTVFLDAGHGGLDPGSIGTTESGQSVSEASVTLPVELDATALLRQQGFRVVVSRTRDTTVLRLGPADVNGQLLSLQGAHDDVAARDVCANLAHAQVLVGIYFDAGYSQDNAGAVTGYDQDRPFAPANLRLATLVQDDVLADLNEKGWGIPNEGVLPDANLGSSVPDAGSSPLAEAAANYDHLLLLGPADPGYFTTPSLMPGAVVEPLFITDPFEGSIAASPVGQHTIATGIDQAIVAYFAPPPKPAATTTTAAPPG